MPNLCASRVSDASTVHYSTDSTDIKDITGSTRKGSQLEETSITPSTSPSQSPSASYITPSGGSIRSEAVIQHLRVATHIDELASEEHGDLFQSLYRTACEAVQECEGRGFVYIGGIRVLSEDFLQHLSELTEAHLRYIVDSLLRSQTTITNFRAYMIACLYRSVATHATYRALSGTLEASSFPFSEELTSSEIDPEGLPTFDTPYEDTTPSDTDEA